MTSEQCEVILAEIREMKSILKDILDYSKPHWEVKAETPENPAINTPRKRSSKKGE